MAALWFDALFELRMGNPGHVAEVAERLRALAEEHELPQGRVAHLCFAGWAEAQLGDPRVAHRLIRQGYEEALRLGIGAWGSETLGYAVEALARAGEWPAARQALEQAMQCAEEIGERHYLPQLLLLEARIAEALGQHTRAHDAARRAVAEARAQDAPWLEMIALSALCERKGARTEDFESLRIVTEQLTEGLESPAVARARALLSETLST
jgi:ATP/maltotriose-dependent transcriptional regulator MalT